MVYNDPIYDYGQLLGRHSRVRPSHTNASCDLGGSAPAI